MLVITNCIISISYFVFLSVIKFEKNHDLPVVSKKNYIKLMKFIRSESAEDPVKNQHTKTNKNLKE